jgi:hypothetical protein
MDQPHVDVQGVVDLAPVVDRDDMRLLKNGRRPRLAQEPRAKCVIFGSRSANPFHLEPFHDTGTQTSADA